MKSKLCDSLEDGITASRAEVFSSEEITVTLSCNYSGSTNNLQWYRQDPGSAPQFLLLITDINEPIVMKAKPPNSRLTAVLNQERNQAHLQISSAAVTDSAVYYCALQPTVTGNNKTLYNNLQRKHNTTQHPLEGNTGLMIKTTEKRSSKDQRQSYVTIRQVAVVYILTGSDMILNFRLLSLFYLKEQKVPQVNTFQINDMDPEQQTHQLN
uniref:Ig-like domain-containing protein n=1 Tax=Oryzias melastigma TaxID=30732 RepID=A0A3B3CK12_ORYME